MKTYLTDYDLGKSFETVTDLEGYGYALVLIRRGRQLMGQVYLQLSAVRPQLTADAIRAAIRTEKELLSDRPELLAGESQSRPPISVIVCTRNRTDALQRCLESLTRLNYPHYEVIVVDNVPSDDSTQRLVESTPFRYVRAEQPGSNRARNRGIEAARYDLLAFTDDDVQVDAGWLEGLAVAFSDPAVMGVTGLILPAELETYQQYLFETYGGFNKGWQSRLYNRANLLLPDLIETHRIGAGASMAFRRSVFEKIGPFDPTIGVGTPSRGSAEVEFFHRVLMQGMTLRYEATALARHQHRRDWSSLNRQIYNYGCGFTVYLLKVWRAGQLNRAAVTRFALTNRLQWLLERLFVPQRFHSRPYPRRLVLVELMGALRAPWAYYATYRDDRQLRNKQIRDTLK